LEDERTRSAAVSYSSQIHFNHIREEQTMNRLKQFIVTVVLLSVAGLFVIGCATIMKGTKQKVLLSSTPSQAKVIIKTVSGMTAFEGTTPATAELSKKDEYIVTVSLAGYKDKSVNITQEGIEGWFWGNLLCGGVIGIVVDVTNGAMHKLSPEQINVELTTAQIPGQEDAVYVVFYALDRQGQLRSLAVPMQRDVPSDFSESVN
jgi:hypothetical protein